MEKDSLNPIFTFRRGYLNDERDDIIRDLGIIIEEGLTMDFVTEMVSAVRLDSGNYSVHKCGEYVIDATPFICINTPNDIENVLLNLDGYTLHSRTFLDGDHMLIMITNDKETFLPPGEYFRIYEKLQNMRPIDILTIGKDNNGISIVERLTLPRLL